MPSLVTYWFVNLGLTGSGSRRDFRQFPYGRNSWRVPLRCTGQSKLDEALPKPGVRNKAVRQTGHKWGQTPVNDGLTHFPEQDFHGRVMAIRRIRQELASHEWDRTIDFTVLGRRDTQGRFHLLVGGFPLSRCSFGRSGFLRLPGLLGRFPGGRPFFIHSLKPAFSVPRTNLYRPALGSLCFSIRSMRTHCGIGDGAESTRGGQSHADRVTRQNRKTCGHGRCFLGVERECWDHHV